MRSQLCPSMFVCAGYWVLIWSLQIAQQVLLLAYHWAMLSFLPFDLITVTLQLVLDNLGSFYGQILLAANPAELRLVLGTHMVEGKNQVPQVTLWYTPHQRLTHSEETNKSVQLQELHKNKVFMEFTLNYHFSYKGGVKLAGGKILGLWWPALAWGYVVPHPKVPQVYKPSFIWQTKGSSPLGATSLLLALWRQSLWVQEQPGLQSKF